MLRGRRRFGDKEEIKLTLNSWNEEKRESGILLNSVTGDIDTIWIE
jgi:hypothetical protein